MKSNIKSNQKTIHTLSARRCRSAIETSLALHPYHAATVLDSISSSTAFHDDLYVETWIQSARRCYTLHSGIVPLDAVRGWHCDPQSGNLAHDSGRFFSVVGVHVRHRVNQQEITWDQPIIEQPEIGILGIIAKRIQGTLHFCLQAKEEPGNIGAAQLSPTVQATYSNYTCAHGGNRPPFLEYFLEPSPEDLMYARLQTEDGGRFLYKSNRNMIVVAGEEFPDILPEGFIWLTLKQISELLDRDNLFNACARSILSSLFWVALTARQFIAAEHKEESGVKGVVDAVKTANSSADIRSTLQWLDDCRSKNHMLSSRIGLKELQEWGVDAKGFFAHRENRFFRIVGLEISTESREIRSWGQPIIENLNAGIIGLLIRNGRNGLEILMQAKAEVGNKSTVQLGPTVQFTQSNYEGSKKLHKPYLYEEFSDPSVFKVVHESRQSEEGARFYREYHLHRILMVPDGMEMEREIPADYRWMPLEDIAFLLHLGEQVNSCARSILFCLL